MWTCNIGTYSISPSSFPRATVINSTRNNTRVAGSNDPGHTLAMLINTNLANSISIGTRGQFHSHCFNPGSREQSTKAVLRPLSDLMHFSPSSPSPGQLRVLVSPIGGQGRGQCHHMALGSSGRGNRRWALLPSPEGRWSVSGKPISLWVQGLHLPHHWHYANWPHQVASIHCQAGNPAFPSPQAWKLSSARQLSVLKEYTDLTFLRSHRRLIS